MADRSILVSAFLRGAQLRATQLAGGATARSILESLILGKFTAEATEGRTLVSTSANGHSVQFALPSELGPGDVLEVAELALQRLDQQADPNGPPEAAPRRVKRLRASFAKAQVS